MAETVKRRRASLGLSQRAAARLANDLSPTTWQNLESKALPVNSLSAAAISRALGWTSDSIDLIRDGKDPIDDPEAPKPVTPDQMVARLSRLEDEVAEVRLLLTEALAEIAALRQQDS